MRTLADSIIYGDIKSIISLLKVNSDTNVYDEYGFTPLIESAIMNKPEIANILLEHNANPNMADTTGRTALHWAVDNNNIELCKLLLKYRANPNAYTNKSQPILVYPLLRKQKKLQKLLIDSGANLDFAQSYINAKLIGHRFELFGQVHIATHSNSMILVDFEGFFLEFSLNIICDSLQRYIINYAAKNMQKYFKSLNIIIKALNNAATLARYQQYSTNLALHQKNIESILRNDTVIIPAIYQGHAITFIKHGNLFAKCDRGYNSKFEGSTVVYHISHPEALTNTFYYNLIYQKQTDAFMHHEINELLGLIKLYNLPILPQVVGNCSWANVEAVIPTLLFLLRYNNNIYPHNEIDFIMKLFNAWREWDKDRALNECIQRYYQPNEIKKVSIVAIIAAVLFQLMNDDTNMYNHNRYQQILPILTQPNYIYIINSYLETFSKNHLTHQGQKLKSIISKYLKRNNIY